MKEHADTPGSSVRERYLEAVSSLVDKLREDPNIIAVILYGSLSYDDVWKKSDVDMTVLVRDQKLVNRSYCLVEDGIVINVDLIQRSHFRRGMEKALGGSITHSIYSKSQILYTTDESLYEYVEEMKKPGERDLVQSMFFHAGSIVYFLQKSEKWLTVKHDPLYSQYYIAKAAEVIAQLEVLRHGEIPTREAILRARQLNPELMQYFYDDTLACHWSRERLSQAIRKLDTYLENFIPQFCGPAIEFLSDGEIKTVSEIVEWFKAPSHFIVEIFDYLSEKGVIEKVSKTIRITPKSRMAVEETAYLYAGGLIE